jgi:penicillin-binding protein 2
MVNLPSKKLQITLATCLMLVLTSCSGLTASGSNANAPILAPLTQTSPGDVVSAFLNSWKTRDYAAMYNQISVQSRDLYTLSVFQTTYENADTVTGLEDLTYTVRDISLQGTSAAVIYDIAITSGLFGTIEDKGRTMRLVQDPTGWRVAWSSMDIFDGLAGGAQIRSIAQPNERANIYDRNGQPVAEQGGTVSAIYTRRQNIPDEAACIDLLATLLRRQRQDLVELFSRFLPETAFYLGEIEPDVDAANSQLLFDLCGVGDGQKYERQTRRYYRGNAVSHVLGYIGQIPIDEVSTWESRGYQAGDLIGRTGIESAFEEHLSGKAQRLLRIIEPGGTPIRDLGSTEGTPPTPIMLTIDRDLQVTVAQALADAYNYAEGSWGARSISTGAAAVVMDVNTGAILAMSSYPLFEPDIFNPDTFCCQPVTAGDRITEIIADARRPLVNRVFLDQFSPGSTYKIITTAAAAGENIRDPNDIFYCDLQWDEGPSFGDTAGFIRGDWRKWEPEEFRFPTGDVTMSQALTSSCDPFFYQMSAELFSQRGPTILVDYAHRMGLGSMTGINYYGPEAAGILPIPGNVTEAINSGIGQGDVKVTPIQMVRIAAAIANGGKVYQPYLVQQIGGIDGTPVTFQAQPTVAVEMGLSEDVLAIIRAGMCEVTTNEKLGTAVWPFEGTSYHVCGKTGTAQTSRYPSAWFVAYVPAENPQIAIAVVVEQSLEGSQVAAPITRRILDAYMGDPVWEYPGLWLDPYTPLTVPEGGTYGG